jgi:general secretion pathway protein K
MSVLVAGRARTSINNDRGIALLLVLWVIALLTVICAEFSWTMRTETIITRNFRDGEQAGYAAEAGIHKAVVELMKNLSRPQSRSTREEADQEAAGQEQAAPAWEAGIGPIPFSFGDYSCTVSIEDENNKISINAFLREAKKNPAKLKALLEEKIGLEGEERDVVADSMIDWWDADHEITGVNGAEQDYYRSLSEPHECRDGDLPVIEELLLVKGIDEQVFYGDAGNPAHATDIGADELQALLSGEGSGPEASAQQQKDDQGQYERDGQNKPNLGLVNIFSTFSTSTTFKIDVNTASAAQLQLLEGMDAETAQMIVSARREKRFASPADRLPEFKNYGVWKKDITIGSQREARFFRIKSRGMVDAVSREITATVLLTKNNFFLMQWQEGN